MVAQKRRGRAAASRSRPVLPVSDSWNPDRISGNRSVPARHTRSVAVSWDVAPARARASSSDRPRRRSCDLFRPTPPQATAPPSPPQLRGHGSAAHGHPGVRRAWIRDGCHERVWCRGPVRAARHEGRPGLQSRSRPLHAPDRRDHRASDTRDCVARRQPYGEPIARRPGPRRRRPKGRKPIRLPIRP